MSNTQPLYFRITESAPFLSPCCQDDYSVCPDCEAYVCVFCADECGTCYTPLF